MIFGSKQKLLCYVKRCNSSNYSWFCFYHGFRFSVRLVRFAVFREKRTTVK